MTFGLTNDQQRTLSQHVIEPLLGVQARVWIFGSRARGDFRPFSDVDLLYEFPASADKSSGLIGNICEAIENSDFPFVVQLVERGALAESYRASVELDKISITSPL